MLKIRTNNLSYLPPRLANAINPNNKTLSTLVNEFPSQTKKGVVKTVKGVFNEDFYKKYISSDEKIREILKTNSKKENLKFYLEIGKLTLIIGGLVAATVLPVPATGTLYAASIPKLRKFASKFSKLF